MRLNSYEQYVSVLQTICVLQRLIRCTNTPSMPSPEIRLRSCSLFSESVFFSVNVKLISFSANCLALLNTTKLIDTFKNSTSFAAWNGVLASRINSLWVFVSCSSVHLHVGEPLTSPHSTSPSQLCWLSSPKRAAVSLHHLSHCTASSLLHLLLFVHVFPPPLSWSLFCLNTITSNKFAVVFNYGYWFVVLQLFVNLMSSCNNWVCVAFLKITVVPQLTMSSLPMVSKL